MKLRATLLPALLLSTALACKASENAPQATMADAPAVALFAPAAPPMPVAEAAARGASLDTTRDQDQGRKIIRSGNLSVEVDDYEQARAALDALLSTSRGFVGRADVMHSDGKVTRATLVLRLPSGGFENAVASIRKLGTVTSESFGAEDVTGEWVDLGARVANAKRLEGRLVELAAKETGNVQQLLEVERELGRVRGEIEQMEARQKVLADLVGLSTLTLEIQTRVPYVAAIQPSLGDEAGRALSGGWAELTEVGKNGLLGFLGFLPWLPFALAGAWLARRGWKKAAAAYGTASGQPKPSA
jgi:hypothetical protein